MYADGATPLVDELRADFQEHARAGTIDDLDLVESCRLAARKFTFHHPKRERKVFGGDELSEVHLAQLGLAVAGHLLADFVDRRVAAL